MHSNKHSQLGPTIPVSLLAENHVKTLTGITILQSLNNHTLYGGWFHWLIGYLMTLHQMQRSLNIGHVTMKLPCLLLQPWLILTS